MAAAARQAIEDVTRHAAGRETPPQPPPCPKYLQRARPGPRADGLTPNQAAIAAVRRRGQPCSIERTALAEGLCTRRIVDAGLILKHAPDLADAVATGERPLFQTAYIARLRRDAPDLAAGAEARMTGDQSKDTRMLTRLWAKVAARKAANGNRR